MIQIILINEETSVLNLSWVVPYIFMSKLQAGVAQGQSELGGEGRQI
jgi:hypothetical protein